ncbi:MAG: hypothetical protein QWI36_04935 [Wolbachia endosymbiont of Tyrophagus putrescentiae]|nr:hypothetical protein [Wolbachia endosymbiont of Tyrophagus putrescentiae]
MPAFVRSLIDGDLDVFHREFKSFYLKTPFFSNYAATCRSLTSFFFGIFATAHDSGVVNRNERIFFRFDSFHNLKIAYTVNKVLRCFTISDRGDRLSFGFSQEEVESIRGLAGTMDVENDYKIHVIDTRSFNDIICKDIICEEVQAHNNRFRSFRSIKNHLRNYDFTEITAKHVALPSPDFEDGSLQNIVAALATNNATLARNTMKKVLRYIIKVHGAYPNAKSHFGTTERNHQFFTSGYLANFSNADLCVELMVGNGRTDIIFLVHRRGGVFVDSVPIAIELKSGSGEGKNVEDALGQVENYVVNSDVSSLSLHTSSRNVVCAGLNFNLLTKGSFGTRIHEFLDMQRSLQERLFKTVGENFTRKDFENDIRDYLKFPTCGVPSVPGIRARTDLISAGSRQAFFYATQFVSASTMYENRTVRIGANEVVRLYMYLFRYNNDENNRMENNENVNVRDHALTMVLRVSEGADREKFIILNIRRNAINKYTDYDEQVYEFVDQPFYIIDLSEVQNSTVCDVICDLRLYSTYDYNPVLNEINNHRLVSVIIDVTQREYQSLGDTTLIFIILIIFKVPLFL